jgi:hypothetical protein
MKTISNILAAAVLAIAAVPAAGQQPGPTGFVRIINAVAAGEGKTSFLINGENLYPKGYELGQMTGGLGLKAGAHTITIRRQGVAEGSTRITVADGETLTLVGFAERKPPAREGDPPTWETRILRLKQSDPGHGFHLTFLSVCDAEEVRVETIIDGRDKPVSETVRRLATRSLSLGRARGEAEVRHGDRALTMVSPDDPGNYVVLLYQDADGQVQALSFYDPKFVIAG